jgi:KaiC/GvpD/RAD55 family RecA-like ATPase
MSPGGERAGTCTENERKLDTWQPVTERTFHIWRLFKGLSRLRVSENRVLRRMFVAKMRKVTGDERRLSIEIRDL